MDAGGEQWADAAEGPVACKARLWRIRRAHPGEEFGMLPATNDVGLIALPDDRRLALAVFVTDAHADPATCEAVIARIAQAVYERAQGTGR